ncbi:DUF2142 domain-containing protein [Frankia sp. AiPa1]|uniref:DUF2142 domain-containing protein n=1 Tax=Frankia sp. AiPa1 TaxID=573492 RepID=UPI00202B17E8|nr:DUF2142 domain-containing protein [Frankia sp. AiPa1]
MVRTLVMAGFALLLAAWVGTNAPGFGPDEPANFIKEVGAGTGQWTGVPGRLAHPAFGNQPGAPERIAWINRDSRVFRLPAGLDPGAAHFPCDLFRNGKSVRCLDRPHTRPAATRALSYVGTYEPYVYAVPGAAMARTHTALGALYTGRAVTAGLVSVLLALALAAGWDSRADAVSMAGVLLAASPMVLFLGSVLGTNGIEIAGVLALYATVLRMGRPGRTPAWTWPAAGIVGALVALSRPTGPAWVLLAPVIGWLLAARRTDQPTHAADHPAAPFPAVAFPATHPPGSAPGSPDDHGTNRRRVWRILWLLPAAGGVTATLLWERAVQPHPGIHRAVVAEGLRRLDVDAQAWTRQWVGVFGWASLPMPSFTYRLWWAAVVVLVVVALVLGSARTRLGFVVVLLGAASLAVGLDVLVLRQTRFPVYGRYLLPLAVLVPLCAGELVTRQAHRLPMALRRITQAAVLLLVTAVHLAGLWADGRRYAVGDHGPAWFLDDAQWTPRGGWALWGAVALAGGACLLGAALAGLVTGEHSAATAPGAPDGPPSRRRPGRPLDGRPLRGRALDGLAVQAGRADGDDLDDPDLDGRALDDRALHRPPSAATAAREAHADAVIPGCGDQERRAPPPNRLRRSPRGPG